MRTERHEVFELLSATWICFHGKFLECGLDPKMSAAWIPLPPRHVQLHEEPISVS